MSVGLLYKIDRYNTHNGPGFRTVIYLKGCPLHCLWCHNPEGIRTQKQVWINYSKCIGCQSCIEACQYESMQLINNRIDVDQEKCVGCYECANSCPSKAIEKIGEEYSANEIIELLIKDKALFDSSGGGVTVTGGEPGLQIEFVHSLFALCKKHGIQTAFDTSGAISLEDLEEIIDFTDIIYMDLKIDNSTNLKRYTGLSGEKFNDTMSWLQKKNKDFPNLNIEFRTPLVPKLTDTLDNLNAFANMLRSKFPDSTWELCMFNDLCEDKYNRLNKDWHCKGLKHDQKDFNRFSDFMKQNSDLEIKISGFIEA